MKDYGEFKILYTTDYRDRSLEGVGFRNGFPIEFKLIDEFLIKKDRYSYDRYELRYLFTTKKVIVDLQQYNHKVEKGTDGYKKYLEIKKRGKIEYSYLTEKYI